MEADPFARLDRATRADLKVGVCGEHGGDPRSSTSKSGLRSLYAHFHSKEARQVQVLEGGPGRFVSRVVSPALEHPRGQPRVRALLDRWLEWARSERLPGGCPFVSAAPAEALRQLRNPGARLEHRLPCEAAKRAPVRPGRCRSRKGRVAHGARGVGGAWGVPSPRWGIHRERRRAPEAPRFRGRAYPGLRANESSRREPSGSAMVYDGQVTLLAPERLQKTSPALWRALSDGTHIAGGRSARGVRALGVSYRRRRADDPW
jgi:AcrR family transcriptional regulator